MEGKWLSITEYASYRNISVSTIRRYIKAGRLKYKLVNGKYIIFVSEENYLLRYSLKEKEDLKLKLEIQELKARVSNLREENNDLKMLIEIYENKYHLNETLPELPQC